MQQKPFLSLNLNFHRLRYPILTVMTALWFTVAAQGGGTVTNCTETALKAALAGGGTVTFACNGTITLTSPIIISAADTVLDGTGHTVTISGNNAVQLFNVDYYTLSLVNLTLANGRSDNGGAIYSSGFVIASNCTFTANNAVGGNGSGGSNGSDGGSFGGSGTAGSAGTTGNGGAIYNSGYTLTLSFCTFLNNKATGGNGGAGGNGGSGISRGGDGGSGGNGAAGFGGAIYSEITFSMTNCSFYGNTASGGDGAAGGAGGTGPYVGLSGNGGQGGEGSGAATYSLQDSTIVGCTFGTNSASGGDGATGGSDTIGHAGAIGGKSYGGGLCNLGTSATINCTFYSNSVAGGKGGNGGPGSSKGGDGGTGGNAYGGGVYDSSIVGVTNCTISSCAATGGAGGAAGTGPYSGNAGGAGLSRGGDIANNGGTCTINNCIFAYSPSNRNIYGTMVDAGANISSDTSVTLSGTGSHSNTNPLLSTLAANGGPTKTCALQSGSPAIDAGNFSAAPEVDQRGYYRWANADIGAFEYAGFAQPVMQVVPFGADASLDGNVGLFWITDSAAANIGPQTISYTLSGTASNGVDYVQLTNSVTIPDGSSYAVVLVRGIPGAFSGTNKSVVLTLVAGANYLVDSSFTSATVTLYDHNSHDPTKRFVRGTSTAPVFQSFVIPLNSQTGVSLDAIAGNATNLFAGNQWTNTLYHFNATNTTPQPGINDRVAFQNPIVAFGSPVGGSALYLNHNYSFGMYAGTPSVLSNALRIQVYYRSNSALAGSINLVVPDTSNAGQLSGLVTNGFAQSFQGFGLTTVMLMPSDSDWGIPVGQRFNLTHTASAAATNYYYVVENKGFAPYENLVLNQSGAADWSRLYVMEFSPFPSGRPIFVDAPHFDGAPLPPAYQGKSVSELTNVTATLPDLSALVASNYLTIDASPELRRHPILDQFVKDMGNDPLALANYVINEIGLTDAMDYDTNYNSQPAVNLGGVDRNALATFQEGQGSPLEQCALLVYFLRQAGIPATYIYPSNNALQMLDFQVSKLLQIQLRGSLSDVGQTNMAQLISLNYPWVAAYVGTNWVQVFPWLKDHSIIEGFDLYDYIPTNYNSGYKWLNAFLSKDTNIFSLSSSDQPLDLLPLFIQNNLNTNAPGLSVDDLGVQIVNRRHLYAQWSDFPKPFSISGAPSVVESLQTNLNLFNTIQIRVYSQAHTNKSVDTTEMRVADLHDRKLLLKFVRIANTNLHDMVLSLNSYSTNITSQTAFSTNADPTWKLITTNRLDSTDDTIVFQVTHRRLRFLSSTYNAPTFGSITNIWSYNYFEQGEQQAGKVYQFTDTFRKGDLLTFCLNVGKVSQKMLNVHAQEIWQFSRNADTNQPSTLDPDVYLGTTAYLMGMSYFNYTDRFNDLNSRLHKVHLLSAYEHGFGLIRPQRDTNGFLPNGGDVNPAIPAVHMPDNGQAVVFNGTLRADSGRDYFSAILNWWLQAGVADSAAEHAVLRDFLQTNAISSVKLLQQVGTNRVALNMDNYLTVGEQLYNGVKLKNADAALWTAVTNFFATATDFDRGAFLTPGLVTNGTYVGVGGILFGLSEFSSPVSGLNGGFANQYPTTTFAQGNSANISVVAAPDGSVTPFQAVLSAAANNASYLVDGATPYWNGSATSGELGNGQVQLDPTLAQAGSQLQTTYSTPGTSSGIYNQVYDSGAAATAPSYYGDGSRRAADPVDTMTGEFYVDSVDLSLPGPMPLQIRRNYSSQNLAENEFGFGWKLSYVPFLSLNTNSTVIYAAEMDGSFVGYRQSGTNASLWFPQSQDNPTLNNNSSVGIGSVANVFNNRLTLSTSTGTNVYTLTGANGSIRTFSQRTYQIGSFMRQRPYLDKWQDNRGNYYTFQYGNDPNQPDYGEVRRIQSSNGNFAGFYYDVYGHIIEAYSGDGRRLVYEYDKFGDLVGMTLPDESEISYQYQHLNSVTNSVTNLYSTHLILQEFKPDGRVLKNDYDSQRRVTNQYATVGVDLKLVRNATFRYTNNVSLGSTNLITGTTTILDYTNRATTYFYTNSLIRKIVDPLNQTITQDWYETDTAGGFRRSLKTRTDKRLLQTTYLYDAFGNVTNTTATGDLLGDGTTVNAVMSATFDTNNLPLQVIDAATNSVTYVYHTNFPFLAQQVIMNAGAVAVSTNFMFYDSVTNVLTVGTNQITNSCFGVLRKQIRAFGSPDATTNEWFNDGRGFPTNAVQYTGTADPNITNQFLVNNRGEMVQRTDNDGRSFRFAFDPLGRPSATETYDTGQAQPMDWTYSYYNDNGELTWSDGPRFDPEDYVWRDYDGAGRKTTEIHFRSEAKSDGTGVQAPADPNLYATTFSQYDPFGNLIQIVDPRGNYSQMDYDALGQMLRQRSYASTGVLLAINSLGYEPGGLVAAITNALGGITTKQYTYRGQPKSQQSADGSTNAWRYYLDGRLRREIQRNGAYWETTYDDANRQTTRIFYSATGSALATNSTVADRRGNAVQNLDAGFNLFTNSFDGLDRIKVAAGPPIPTAILSWDMTTYSTSIVQQITTSIYDSSGKTLIVSNALGEKTITTNDAIGRPLSIQIFPTNSATPIRVTTIAYAANHHSFTVTNGSGGTAFASTFFSDNDGNPILSINYPFSNAREYTRNQYDLTGNLIYEERDSSTNGAVTVWTTANYTYDGLNRLLTKSDRDAAVTSLYYDAAGNVTNRVMPGSLKWQAIYNNAGQMLQELNLGASGGTRTNTYSYFPGANAFAGLLSNRVDGLGVTCAYVYDDYLRTITNTHSLGTNSIVSSWVYDVRGLVTDAFENYSPSIGSSFYTFPSSGVSRIFDAYGQIVSEVEENLASGSYASQNWNAAGRRSSLALDDFIVGYSWRADGLMASAGTFRGGATYNYDTAGFLTNRVVGNRVTTITSRDGVGRPLSITNTINTGWVLSETLTRTGDGLLSTHTVARNGQFTDNAVYSYAGQTRRLTNEVINLNASTTWTNTFNYDGGAPSGLGVLTKAGSPNATSSVWSGVADPLSRVATETNTVSTRQAYGRVNGSATVTALIDGQPMPLALLSTGNHDWGIQWRSTLELSPGAHQLSVSALHPSGQFTTNQSVWFTNNMGNQIISDTFDAMGQLTQRVWKNQSGVTNRTQTLIWDLNGRLSRVLDLDSQTNGVDWNALYDPINRRPLVWWYPITGGTYTSYATQMSHFFDPEVEFLELGSWGAGFTTWKLCGPDLDGRYGGLNGTGGLDAIMEEPGIFEPTLSDAQGNVLGYYETNLVWSPSRPTGYGAAPGYRPLAQETGVHVAQAAAWRGRPQDVTGFVWLGERYYNPENGGFLSADSEWNGGDPNYYTFCGGDPINYFDPNGTCLERDLQSLYNEYVANQYESRMAGAFSAVMVSGDISPLLRANGVDDFFNDMVEGALKGNYATDAGSGAGLGNALFSSIPGVGTVTGIRDLSADVRNLGDGGWRSWRNWRNTGITALAAVPFVGWVKSVARTERGASEVARVTGALEHVPHTPPGVGGTQHYSPTLYPNPDPRMSVPPVRYEPSSIAEVERMREGLGPTTKAEYGTGSIEAHHRQQIPIENGGVIDELTQQTHRGIGNHSRHSGPSRLTPQQRAREIEEHWTGRGAEYILPGEGI